MTKRLTPRQQEILAYVRKFIKEQKISPSLSEIAGYFNISNSTAAFHLKALEKKRELRRSSNARSIRLNRDTPVCSIKKCPHRIALDQSSPRSQGQEAFWVPEKVLKICPQKEFIIFTVTDDSMIGLGIYNGDTVLAMPLEYRDAYSGDLVIAELRDGTVCIRSYMQLSTRQFELLPANREFKSEKFRYSENPIRAVVTALLRKY